MPGSVNALLPGFTVENPPRGRARGSEVMTLTQPEGIAAAISGRPALVRPAAACAPPHTANATATLAVAAASLNG